MSKKVWDTLLLHHTSIIIYTEGFTACLQPFWLELHPLLWASVWDTHGKIAVSGIVYLTYLLTYLLHGAESFLRS